MAILNWKLDDFIFTLSLDKLTPHATFWVNKRMINMAEEFKKYKDILAREQKEFREEIEREVSALLPFQLAKEKQDLKGV